MRYDKKRGQILAKMGVFDQTYERFIADLYVNKSMSGIEISEYIEQKTGVSITPRSIQRTLAKHNLTRDRKKAFNLAIKRGRVQWAYKEHKYKRVRLNSGLRYEILERDGFKCMLCGNTAEHALLEIDHIIPICKGGLSTKDNLQTLCHVCNKGKQVAKKEK